jgi:hypothetical protein
VDGKRRRAYCRRPPPRFFVASDTDAAHGFDNALVSEGINFDSLLDGVLAGGLGVGGAYRDCGAAGGAVHLLSSYRDFQLTGEILTPELAFRQEKSLLLS